VHRKFGIEFAFGCLKDFAGDSIKQGNLGVNNFGEGKRGRASFYHGEGSGSDPEPIGLDKIKQAAAKSFVN
jgi:hypothetical protein